MKKVNINQIEIEEASSRVIYYSIIEALLFASGEPLSINNIASIIECSDEFTKNILDELILKYETEERGIKLINVNNKYQLVTKPQHSSYIQKILKSNSRQSLSQASLETLAIIAYKQPITRVDIDEIRGVKSDSAVITLADRKLIKESGRLDVPGRPILYSTTDDFLRYFGIKDLKEMPSLESLDEAIIQSSIFTEEEEK